MADAIVRTDGELGSGGGVSPDTIFVGVQNIAALAAIPVQDRADKQIILVEDKGILYRFDAEDTTADGDGPPPITVDTDDVVIPNDAPAAGRWNAIGSPASISHNALSGLQGGNATERFHLTSAQESGLTGGGNTSLHRHANATGGADGFMASADKSKLDGVEAGAKDDQTGAEIKIAYEGEANTNAFEDAEKTKLAGIEAAAKDDQIASEVPFTPTGTVASTDVQAAIAEAASEAEQVVNKNAANGYAPLDAASDLPLANLPNHATGHTDGTDDIQDATAAQKGLATAAQITKLDGIETAATADQTAGEIKTAYESNADTNEFSDAEQTKLAGVEAGAAADQIASEVPFTPAGTIAATDVQAAIVEAASEAEQIANKGAASGYAPLDGSADLPLANLPAHKSTHVSGGSDPFVAADILEAASRGVRISLRNESGSPLSKGDLVSVGGFSVPEGRPTVDLADKDLAAFRPAIAVVEATVANNTNFEGLVVGLLTGLDTSSFVVNAQLVLGDDGQVSTPPPDTDPFTGEVQLIGSVVRSDVSNGSIYFSLSSTLLPMTAAQFFWTKENATTGSISGGDVTRATGLNVDVALGEGFVNTGSTLFRVTWAAVSNLLLTANDTNFIFVDSAGLVQKSVSLPDSESNIVLATAITNGTDIVFLANHKILLQEHSAKAHQYAEDVVGPITVSGLITKKDAIALRLEVDAGTFYTRDFRVTVPATDPITFTYWHRDGSGGFTKLLSQTTIDPENFDDGSGTLAAITAGKYKKDLLFIAPTSSGVVEYHVFYGQEEFDTQSAAEAGNLPAADSDVLENSIRSGGIVVLKSAAVIASVVDVRPFLGQLSPGTTAVTDHSLLSGLGGTDHPAYQEGAEKGAVNGYAPLDGSADLPLANLPAHASTHERAGSDELDGDHLGIDFTPANYTPDITPPEAADVDDLAAHLKGIDTALSGGGLGDVVGPGSAVDSNLASFNTTTGKLIKDSGIAQADVEQTPNKNTSNGYAGLDAGSRIAKAQGHSATVYTDQANVYSAGSKQSMQADATNAGLRLVGLAGDPSTPVDGDLWHNTTTDVIRARLVGVSQTLEHQGNKGAVNGYAPLDGSSDLPLANLPNHASNHTDGTDDIQNATAAQKGLATAAQITKLDGIETAAKDDQIASEVAFTPAGTIAATDVQAAIEEAASEAEQTVNKNTANGYPGLSAGSKITGSQQTYGTGANTAAEGNDSRIPTQAENDALVGTGTPSSSNVYVNDDDVRFDLRGFRGPDAGTFKAFAGTPAIESSFRDTSDEVSYRKVKSSGGAEDGGLVYEFVIPEGVTAIASIEIMGKVGNVADQIDVEVREIAFDGTIVNTTLQNNSPAIQAVSKTKHTITSFTTTPTLNAGDLIVVEVKGVLTVTGRDASIGPCIIKWAA